MNNLALGRMDPSSGPTNFEDSLRRVDVIHDGGGGHEGWVHVEQEANGPDELVFSDAARREARRRPARDQWDSLGDQERLAMEGRASGVWSAQDAVQPVCALEPGRNFQRNLPGAREEC